jgi:serine/threonine-protein kinase
MGVIYLAHDPDIDRPVAIKLIRSDLLESGERADYLARFRHEAQAAGRCSHPNIVTIHDFAIHDGNPFLVMEYVDGVSLTQARARGEAVSPPDAVLVIGQVLDALAQAHAMGIVHRDIKPANIMIVGGRHVKVADFGISRFNTSAMTQTGAVVGTPSYMSPEQCRGDPVDPRSDLFSTGAVLYEMLCGDQPFAGKHYAEVMHKLLHDAPPDLTARAPAIPPALKAVVDRALAKQPEDRFASAADMAAALRQALGAPGGVPAADATIFAPRAPAPDKANPPTLGASLIGQIIGAEGLAELERRLAHYVGPIAHYLLQSAIRKAASVDDLCDTLAGNIEGVVERTAFRQQAMRHLRGSAVQAPTHPSHAALPDRSASPGMFVPSAEELDHVQKALTAHMGPVARILVKRAAVGAVSLDDLWSRLAADIEREADRKVFLKKKDLLF